MSRNEEKKLRSKRLCEYAKNLNENMPKSEQWFLAECEKRKVNLYFTQNEPFHSFIPDFINTTYRIIIEVDGSVHNLKHVKEKDKKKDRFYKSKGYIVIRIKAFDNGSLNRGLDRLFKAFSKKKAIVKQKRASLERKKNFVNRTKAVSYSKKSLDKCQVCKTRQSTCIMGDSKRTFKVCDTCKSKVVI